MARSSVLRPFAESWQFRELVRQLVVRNLKVRYQRSVLGFVWLLVNPLLTIGILVLVFGHIVRLPVPHYWAFLASGYFCWVFLLHTLSMSTFIIPEHASMSKSVAVPADVFVISAVTSRLIEFASEMLLVVVLLAVFHHGYVPPSFVLVPVLMCLLLLLTLGLALPAAALAVFFRDVQHGLPVALTMLMYLSPVFYPAEFVPPSLERIYYMNPVAILLTLFHTVLYSGRWPPVSQLASAAIVSCGLYVAGYLAFRRQRDLFAEIV